MATRERKKLTLDQVETQMEVLTKEEMNALKGGGDGSYNNPYTIDEYNMLNDYGIFIGGYVSGMGYVHALAPVTVSPRKNNSNFGSGRSNYSFGSFYQDNYSDGGGGGGSSNFGGSIYYTGGGSSFSSYGSIYGPSPDMGGGYGGGGSSHSFGNNSPYSNFVKAISDLWNSTTARVLIPDVFSINLSTSATAFIGVNFEFSINFITRGNDASLIPVISIAPGVQGGLGVFADASVGASRGYFTVTDVRKLKMGEAVGNIQGWAIDGTMGLGKGAGGSVNVSISFDENGKPVFFKVGTSAGATFGSGLTVGGSHTLIVKPKD